MVNLLAVCCQALSGACTDQGKSRLRIALGSWDFQRDFCWGIKAPAQKQCGAVCFFFYGWWVTEFWCGANWVQQQHKHQAIMFPALCFLPWATGCSWCLPIWSELQSLHQFCNRSDWNWCAIACISCVDWRSRSSFFQDLCSLVHNCFAFHVLIEALEKKKIQQFPRLWLLCREELRILAMLIELSRVLIIKLPYGSFPITVEPD